MKTNIDLLLKQLNNLKQKNNQEKSVSNQNHVLTSLYQMLTMPKSEVKATKHDADLNELDFDNRDLLSDGFEKYNIRPYEVTNRKGFDWHTQRFEHVNQSLVNKVINFNITELKNK